MKRAMVVILIIGVIGLAYKLIKRNFYQKTHPASYYNANKQTIDSIIFLYEYISQNLGEFPTFRRAGGNGEIFIFQLKDNESGFRVVSTKDGFEVDLKKNFTERVDQSSIIPLIKHLQEVNASYFQKLEEPCRVYLLGYEDISLLDRQWQLLIYGDSKRNRSPFVPKSCYLSGSQKYLEQEVYSYKGRVFFV